LEEKDQKFDPTFFKKVLGVAGKQPVVVELDGEEHVPMSQLTRQWIFPNIREFQLPYEKRTYLTNFNDAQLEATGWTDWVSDRIDYIHKHMPRSCRLSVQIQPFGGKFSQYRKKAETGETAYSWRKDSTVCCVVDCFHQDNDNAKYLAQQWQQQNDEGALGPNGRFSKEDKRVLWGSYGTRNLNSAWPAYYENEAKYKRLCELKKRVDPKGVLTPNAFCVGVTKFESESDPALLPKPEGFDQWQLTFESNLFGPAIDKGNQILGGIAGAVTSLSDSIHGLFKKPEEPKPKD